METEIKTPERRIFGEYPEISLPVDRYVMLPQVRSGLNPDLDELKGSIDSKGLLNPIDVICMSAPQLESYIEFVNSIWKTEAGLDDYRHQEMAGMYYVVIAGHSRTEAVRQLSSVDESGSEYFLRAKLHDISDPHEIIALQLDENIHSKPAQERRAMAVVEAYEFGKRQGQWSNERDFINASHGKVSPHVLKEAIGFVRLPPAARDFIFAGKLSYAAGVSIGQASETIYMYTTARMGFEQLDEESRQSVDETYNDTVSLLIAQITNRRLNSTAAKKYIRGRVDEMTAWLQAQQNGEDPAELFELVSSNEQATQYKRALDRDLKRVLRDMAQEPHLKAVQLLSLHEKLIGRPVTEVREVIEQSIESGRRAVGQLALKDTALINSDEGLY